MSGGAKLGVEAFQFGLDKGYDRIPDHIFLTPKERKQRREQKRREQAEGQRQPNPGSGPQGSNSYNQTQQQPQAYGGATAGYSQDPYAQDPNFDRSRDLGSSSREDTRQIEDDPYWNQGSRTGQNTYMQGDGYDGGGGGGRRAYNPSDYEPRYQGYDDGYGRDQYAVSSSRDPYARPSSAGRVDRYRPASYDDGYDGYDDDYDRRDSRRERSSKSKSQRSRSRSGIRGKLDKSFDKSERGLTTGALGAIAGGLVGHEVGKGPLATVAGVVLGGLGANAFEARHERHKSGRESQPTGGRRAKSSDARGGGLDDEYSRRNRSGYDDDDDDDDSYDDDNSGSKRLTGAERRERRRMQREKSEAQEEREKHFGWGNTLRT